VRRADLGEAPRSAALTNELSLRASSVQVDRFVWAVPRNAGSGPVKAGSVGLRSNSTPVERHFLWLEAQHRDVYVRDVGIAVNYIGQEHFEPLEFFDGEPAFRLLIERDRRKANCVSNTALS
jgi:hypothetical protein